MAQRHHDLTGPAAGPAATGDALAGYLRAQATEFLRALRLHRESGGAASHGSSPAGGPAGRAHPRAGEAGTAGGPPQDRVDAVRALRRSARRISGSLHTFRPLLDPEWSEEMRPELAWLSGTLALEHAYGARLERLLLALNRLSGSTPTPSPAQTPVPGTPTATPKPLPAQAHARSQAQAQTQPHTQAQQQVHQQTQVHVRVQAQTQAQTQASGAAGQALGGGRAGAQPAAPDRGNLTVGAAKAGALLDRQLTLARTRAHSTALQALGSSRFHAVADKVAVLASEVPLTPAALTADLRPLARAAEERLTDAVTALPLITAGSPYNAEALIHGLSPDPAPHPQDAPWHQVRLLLRLHRYACEVVHDSGAPLDARLLTAGQALDRHRDASEAAAAAAQAARTPRIAPATAYALGVLHADQRHEVEAARYAFQRSWQKQTIGTPWPDGR
ncbi:CHAD domain-containing protein [Streptomyces humidus]|uniref:CHAD domain-containing protein n=1 Tax=Streptomyces humidus TaxID=52259 RepID=A0A918G064_9ACTN|nr:CHAD domain-containing protein [Streptomyces humidus]GGS08414.1 CHAD domain-containing protein [Streptomyces humidus]